LFEISRYFVGPVFANFGQMVVATSVGRHGPSRRIDGMLNKQSA
jgi:hypothetical protein